MKRALLLVLLLTGCSHLKEHRDPDGLYRLRNQDGTVNSLWTVPERAFRDETGNLVTDEATLRGRARPADSPEDLYGLPACSDTQLYRAKAAQFAAVDDLRENRANEALVKLDEAERHCPGLQRISAQDYWRARAYSAQNQPERAREAARHFLRTSAAVDPAAFVQSDGPRAADDIARYESAISEFARYRANAQAFVEGRESLNLITPPEPAKFTTNAFYRPGGNQREGILAMPTIIYSNQYGLALGAAAYYAIGKYGVGASASSYPRLGPYYGFKLRYGVYESPKRDWNVETFLLGHTNKRFSYDEVDGEWRNVRIEETAFEGGLGAGATKRWTPQFGVSSELRVYSDQIYKQVDVVGSLYAFYDVFSTGGPTLGYVLNGPMLGWTFFFLHGGFNFRTHGFDLLIEGLTF